VQLNDIRLIAEAGDIIRKDNGRLEARGSGHDDVIDSFVYALECLKKTYGEFKAAVAKVEKKEEDHSGFSMNKSYEPGTMGAMLKRALSNGRTKYWMGIRQ